MEGQMHNANAALVLGATGGVGGEVARSLVARGWQVTAMVRSPSKAPDIAGVRWVAGDAMQGADVLAAAKGAAVIVHAVNPPGYKDWDKLVLPMMANTIAAAKASGARILLPGTIYNYGVGSAGRLPETTAQLPSSRKGAIRVQMELMLREAAAGGVRSLIVRAGDFFSPRTGNSWFAQGLVKPGVPLSAVSYPGAPGAGHAWAYLPDLADTMVRLLEQESRLADFDTFHFRGHYDVDGSQMAAAIRRASGNERLKIRAFPWALTALAAPFVTVLREMREMRYLWQHTFELDNGKLLRFLGQETHTPLDRAVRDTLEGLGCLPAPMLAQAA
jgi:nucleoside-diphosphate-sugar epimerase